METEVKLGKTSVHAPPWSRGEEEGAANEERVGQQSTSRSSRTYSGIKHPFDIAATFSPLVPRFLPYTSYLGRRLELAPNFRQKCTDRPPSEEDIANLIPIFGGEHGGKTNATFKLLLLWIDNLAIWRQRRFMLDIWRPALGCQAVTGRSKK